QRGVLVAAQVFTDGIDRRGIGRQTDLDCVRTELGGVQLDQCLGKGLAQRFAGKLVAIYRTDTVGLGRFNNGVVVIQHVAARAVLLLDHQVDAAQVGRTRGDLDQVGLA